MLQVAGRPFNTSRRRVASGSSSSTASRCGANRGQLAAATRRRRMRLSAHRKWKPQVRARQRATMDNNGCSCILEFGRLRHVFGRT